MDLFASQVHLETQKHCLEQDLQAIEAQLHHVKDKISVQFSMSPKEEEEYLQVLLMVKGLVMSADVKFCTFEFVFAEPEPTPSAYAKVLNQTLKYSLKVQTELIKDVYVGLKYAIVLKSLNFRAHALWCSSFKQTNVFSKVPATEQTNVLHKDWALGSRIMCLI